MFLKNVGGVKLKPHRNTILLQTTSCKLLKKNIAVNITLTHA